MRKNDRSDLEKVLKRRASVYASRKKKPAPEGAMASGLEFLLSDERYIINSAFIMEVMAIKELTPLPCAPGFITGIINVRGKILSVISLKQFLNLAPDGMNQLSRVIIVKHGEIEVGILADEVTGAIRYSPDLVKPLPATIPTKQQEYLTGITAERSIVFHLEKFLSSPEIIVCEEA